MSNQINSASVTATQAEDIVYQLDATVEHWLDELLSNSKEGEV